MEVTAASTKTQQQRDLGRDEDAIEERKHVEKVVNAFMFYKYVRVEIIIYIILLT